MAEPVVIAQTRGGGVWQVRRDSRCSGSAPYVRDVLRGNLLTEEEASANIPPIWIAENRQCIRIFEDHMEDPDLPHVCELDDGRQFAFPASTQEVKIWLLAQSAAARRLS